MMETIRPSWEQRITRARELADTYHFAAEVLTFYASVAEFQRGLYGVLDGAPLRSRSWAFRDSLDLSPIIGRFPVFLKLVQHAGPVPLADTSVHLEAEGPSRWEQILRNFWARSGEEFSASDMFFARAILQPYAERVAERISQPAAAVNTPTCPVCDSEPVVAVLRPEGFGARRSFICSFCSTEWQHLRMVCPGCGEDDHEALCFYLAEQFDHMRVDACDTCKTYIKTVDLSKNGLAIPVVDEIASLPLTLWAEENGYTRLQPNLIAV